MLLTSGRPPRKRLEEETVTSVRPAATTPRRKPAPSAPTARAAAPAESSDVAPPRERYPPLNRNGSARGAVPSDSGGDDPYPVFSSRRERDRYEYAQDDGGGSSEEEAGEHEEEGGGEGRTERARGGAGRVQCGRRFGAVGGGRTKRSSRSCSSAGSEESFADAAQVAGRSPKTPIDRRLRAAGSSPMG